MSVFDEQKLHMSVFSVPSMAMDGRLCASPEYRDLIETLVGKEDDIRFRHSPSETIRCEVASRQTPLMRELLKVLDANWADWANHYTKHRNAGRPVYPAVKRIQKAVAKASA